MFNRFKEYVENNKLFKKNDKLLVGVSGGIDSVVLVQLIDQLKMDYAIAHCNFKLRGSESDADEAFVSGLANHLKVPFFSQSFNTEVVARQEGISIEMAARDLRYAWFEEIRSKNKFNWIVVGHHQDDLIETFMLNMSRGTGIRGLSGIKNVSGKVVRPMLFASRSEINDYAVQRSLIYRTDSSNRDQTIPRNKIRLNIIPLFEEINPAFRKNVVRTIDNLSATEKIYLSAIGMARNELVSTAIHGTLISIKKLVNLETPSAFLFELISPYGFNNDQVNDIVKALEGQSGTTFLSGTHRLIVDREYLIINDLSKAAPSVEPSSAPKERKPRPKQLEVSEAKPGKSVRKTEVARPTVEVVAPSVTSADGEVILLEKKPYEVVSPVRLKITVERYTPGTPIPDSPNMAVFDYFKLNGQLSLRRWHAGDAFNPLGMKGFKKVSDFFIDEKLSIPEKERTWILCTGTQIAWLVGHRIDDRYKVNPITRMVLKVEYFPE